MGHRSPSTPIKEHILTNFPDCAQLLPARNEAARSADAMAFTDDSMLLDDSLRQVKILISKLNS